MSRKFLIIDRKLLTFTIKIIKIDWMFLNITKFYNFISKELIIEFIEEHLSNRFWNLKHTKS